MMRHALFGLLALPGAAAAQDKAAMCVTVIDAMRAIEASAVDMTDDAADFHNEMLAMRDRIGGLDGASLEMRSERHLLDTAGAMNDARRAADDARNAIVAYCAP